MNAAQANAEIFNDMQQDHTLALVNLATATQADMTSHALLAKMISEPSGQVALLTAKIATAQAKYSRMKISGQKPTTAGHGHRAARNTTPSDPNPSQDRNLHSRSGQRFDPNGYCSSHRYKLEESHTSATYLFTTNGHNKSATRLNIMGGNTWNKEYINGIPTE